MTITIPKETLDRWKPLRGRDDIKALCKITGLSRSAVYYILSNGKCTSKRIASQVIRFHTKLEQEVNEITKQLEQEA